MCKFKCGDKVICVNNIGDSYNPITDLTYGKVYSVWDDSAIFFNNEFEVVYIMNDDGVLDNYNSSRFVSVIEYRTIVIDNILE